MTSTDRELGRAVDTPSPARQPARGACPPSAPRATIADTTSPGERQAGESHGNSPATIGPLRWAAEIAREAGL